MASTYINDKMKQIIGYALDDINSNNFSKVYNDAEDYEADPELVGNITQVFLQSGLDPLQLDPKLKNKIPYAYLAFADKIPQFEIPNSITDIDKYAFYHSQIEDIRFQKGSKLEQINKLSFCKCSKLKKLILPEPLAYIGDQAFSNCFNLVKLVIPKSLNYIGVDLFENCYNLSILEYEGTKEEFESKLLNFIKVDNSKNTYIDKIRCIDGDISVK